MTPFHAVTAALIVVGSGVLALGAKRTLALLRLRQVTPHAGPWRVLLSLIVVCIAAYIATAVVVLLGLQEAVVALTGVIFLGGGVFVYLAADASFRTMQALVKSSMTQRQVGDMLEALSHAVLLVDDRGVVRTVNRKLCEITGLPASALVGKSIMQAVGLENPFATSAVKSSIDMPHTHEHELRRRDGAVVPVAVAIVPAHRGFVCVLTDIREDRLRRRQLDDAVRIAEEILRARNEFMALVAVELRDPLGQLSRASRALVDAPPEADVAAMARKIGVAGEQLERVAQSLLEVGRLGGSAEGARVFQPAALLRDAAEALSVQAGRAGVIVRHYVEQGVPSTFYGREAQIRQILGLLGLNAIARAPGGEIRIAVEPVPGDKSSHQLLFSVRDTGYPLTDTTADVEFDPLTSGARSQGGRLDLAICRLLVLSLGGRMSAGNTTGNTATVFFTVLGGVAPGSQQAALVNALGETQAVASLSGGGWKNSFEASARLARLAVPDAGPEPERRTGSVLVVDDSPTSRELLAHQLRQAGNTVEVAGTASEALDLVWQQEFDVVLLDVLLPDSDGIAVLEELREKGALERLSVLMISAVEETSSVAACIERGAEDFLPKPVSPALLRARLGACLEKKFLRDKARHHLIQLAAEGRRANDLLRVLLPDPIADELQSTGTIAPRRLDNVAVVFADIVGFTAYCDRHSPEEVLISLQDLFTRFEQLALEFGVQKIKTIGDSFMGAAGLFSAEDERPALRCVQFGRAILAAGADLATHWNLRIGIHVGPVVGGVVGTRQYIFDIWGDTVNTAQRIEQNARVGQVCISAAARRQVEPDYETESIGLSEIKGKGEAEIFIVVGGPN
ncbi:adenylate/guanylate cyclase domain-containing protein [Nannocystis bainbridge]|uniref:Adenylate/guanylate cyclase domain-containing protein n=1 Tax=Nannocystis bainbridge TaxID=2995303 RepID=A0ABT5DXJ4_9BACT|nr:adenylate/guanylate cyclase domain-containing protein [Nannocystis bainbridge]MDC0718309.1 adenylate/guanylate cyclase domain-containing protein [Nannocystis bainbridge]